MGIELQSQTYPETPLTGELPHPSPEVKKELEASDDFSPSL